MTEPEERQLQPANGAFVQQPAAAAESAAEAGSSNDLARLFAGMKVPGPPAAVPAAIPAPAAPTAAAPMVLLTPQLLQQEAAGGAAQAEQGAATEPATAPGNLLLQSLLRGSQQAPQPQQALQQPAPAPRAVDITGKSAAFARLLSIACMLRLVGHFAFASLRHTRKTGMALNLPRSLSCLCVHGLLTFITVIDWPFAASSDAHVHRTPHAPCALQKLPTAHFAPRYHPCSPLWLRMTPSAAFWRRS